MAMYRLDVDRVSSPPTRGRDPLSSIAPDAFFPFFGKNSTYNILDKAAKMI